MKPRFNAAPSQNLPVIFNSNPRKILLSPWGLKPAWLSKLSKRDGLINVRAETLRDKQTFHDDLEQRRCLIPADGFYEWQKRPDGRKVPFRIVRKDGKLFAFAGIWEFDQRDLTHEPRFAIITTAANELMQPIHSRMPVILEPEQERTWLESNQQLPDILRMLRPAQSGELKAYEVSRLVNRGTVDIPDVIKPAA